MKPDILRPNCTAEVINDSNIISDRLSSSFYSVNTSSLSKNDPTLEYKEFRHKVKAYIHIFKEHIFESDHPINKISKMFINYFGMYIDEELKDINNAKRTDYKSYKDMVEHRINSIVKQLQNFILKLQASLRLMYAKTINYSCFVEEKDEFVNLITNLLFREDMLYNKIIEVYKTLLYDKISQLEINFCNLKDIRPEDLSLNEKYCLNETTKKCQQRILEEYNRKKLDHKKEIELMKKEPSKERLSKFDILLTNSSNSESKVKNNTLENQDQSNTENEEKNEEAMKKEFLDRTHSSHNIKNDCMKMINNNENDMKKNQNSDLHVYSSSNNLNESIKKTLKTKRGSSKKKEYKNVEMVQGPFGKAITLLKTLVNYKVPFEKMMLISTISLEITECVNDFWKEFEHIIAPNNLNIDADELMSIFIYILIKSDLYDLLIHTRIIKDFTTSSSKSTMIGYYYVTLEASLLYILEIKSISDLKSLEKNKAENEILLKNNTGIDNVENINDNSSSAQV